MLRAAASSVTFIILASIPIVSLFPMQSALAIGETQKTWAKTYGGSDFDFDQARSVQQTSDGGYIVAWAAASCGADNSDAWLLKLDSDGNVEWEKTYGGSGGDGASSVQQTTDGGYIVGGIENSFGSSSIGNWLLKLDSDGNV